MSWLSFFAPKNKDLVGIIDLGSGSVGGAIAHLGDAADANRCVELLKISRHDLTLGDEISFDKFMTDLTAALGKVMAELTTSQAGTPSAWHVFLGSPLYASQTRLVHRPKSAPKPITKKEIQELVANDLASFQTAQAQIYQTAAGDTNEVIESKVMQVILNGYPIDNFNKQLAAELDVAHYVSLGSAHTFGRLRQVISGAIHHESITLHSSAFSLFSLLRDFSATKSFLAIDVTGELTDVVAVVDGVLTENISFPFGTRTIERQLAPKVGGAAAATSTLKMSRAGTLASTAQTTLDTTVAAGRDAWLASFKKACQIILEHSILPEQVLLVADSSSVHLFEAWLKEAKLDELTMSHSPLTVEVINERLFKGLCRTPNDEVDIFLMTDALFCAKLNQS